VIGLLKVIVGLELKEEVRRQVRFDFGIEKGTASGVKQNRLWKCFEQEGVLIWKV
jgi:hypothetical protein